MNTQISAVQGTWLVAERELVSKLRSKSFIITTVILVVLALAAVIFAGVRSATAEPTPVAVTPAAATALEGQGDLNLVAAADREVAVALVRNGEVDAAVVEDESSPTGFTIIADTSVPSELIGLLSVSPTVELLDPEAAAQSGLRYLLGFGFGIIFMMAAITFGSPITQSVVEEKSTRVVEILISTIPARVLLAGKVLGNTILAVGQILVLIAVVTVGLIVTDQSAILSGLGAPMVWFAVFFLFGFILLAAMFAAAGALVSRQEDTGATMTPIIYLVMIPYFVAIVLGDNPIVMTIMSYVPFSAAVAMPIRVFFGDAFWWEPLLALVVLLLACLAVIGVGAKIYQNSLLKMGARVKLREALKG